MSIRHVGTGNYRDFRSRMIIQFDAKIAFRQSESSPSAGKKVTPIIFIVANPYYLPCLWISCHNLVVPDNHHHKVDCIQPGKKGTDFAPLAVARMVTPKHDRASNAPRAQRVPIGRVPVRPSWVPCRTGRIHKN
jgi:hypothetical protein